MNVNYCYLEDRMDLSRILRHIEGRADRMVSMLKDMVAIDTSVPPGSN
jgi:hypothetical protein